MKPTFSVSIPSFTHDTTEMINWCVNNIGKPYRFDKLASYSRFDWEDEDGKWCMYAQSNTYNRLNDDQLVDTWWFRDEKDATLFILKWK